MSVMVVVPSPDADEPRGDEDAERWQHKLASRIIIQAFRDLRSPHALQEHRASARLFLAGSPMLRYWCHVGALDLRRITGRARRLMRVGATIR